MPKVGVEHLRRAAVINAALECIYEKGIDSLTLEAVAARAGFSKGVAAYYFKTKKQLILASFQAFLSYYKVKIDGDIKPGMSAVQMLEVFTGHALPPWSVSRDFSGEAINVSELQGVDQMNLPPEKKAGLFLQFFSRAASDEDLQRIILEAYHKDVEGISRLIQYGIGTENFKYVDSYPAAYGMLAMVVGLSFFRVAGFHLPCGKDNRTVFEEYLENTLMRGSSHAE